MAAPLFQFHGSKALLAFVPLCKALLNERRCVIAQADNFVMVVGVAVVVFVVITRIGTTAPPP